MKKCVVLVLCVCILTGCSAEVYETLGDVEHVSATAPEMGKVVLQLPGDAAVLTASGGNTMYTCQDYSLAVQTLPGGNLHTTIQSVSGFEKSQLMVMETVCGDHKRYEFVWIAAGEGGDTVCRAAVIDDGNYHYCVTAMADAKVAAELREEWNAVLGSFCLETQMDK